MKELTITFIGSGNVADALAREMVRNGLKINYIISRNKSASSEIARATGSIASHSFIVPAETDLVIVAVSDNAIREVLTKLSFTGEPIVVHTSGATDLSVFPKSVKKYGVIYPLQTFTRGRELSLGDVNIFTEASDEKTHETIDKVAQSISMHVHRINSSERKILHLSAVFVSNFVNHMLLAGFETAANGKIDPAVLEPLVRETIAKAFDLGPAKSQTGPASRNDTQTIKKHIELLSFSDDLKNLYRMVSDSIIKHTEKKKMKG
jgi:predicted short-subunit dehydrogenase-like oxidoreductase (DUF2520 family)